MVDTFVSIDLYLKRAAGNSEAKSRVERFLNNMKQRRYQHLVGLRSNYARTNLSVSSFFKLDYLNRNEDVHHSPEALVTKGVLGRIFKNSGYKLYSSQYTNSCLDGVECFRIAPSNQLMTFMLDQTPILSVLKKLDKYLIEVRSFPLVRRLTASLNTQKLKEIDGFIDFIRSDEFKKETRPKFVYSWFIGPHPENYFNENCQVGGLSLELQVSGEQKVRVLSLQRYLPEYLCFLSQVERLTKTIDEISPDAVVVIISDHGYGVAKYGVISEGKWDQLRFDETFHVFGFAKAPEECTSDFEKSGTNVNLFRTMVNCLAGKEILPKLKDGVSTMFTPSPPNKSFDPTTETYSEWTASNPLNKTSNSPDR